MYVGHQDKVKADPAPMPGAKGAYIQWLLAKPEGAGHFYMRRIILEQGGVVPEHSHPEDHEIYTLTGEGQARADGVEAAMTPGTVLFVPGGQVHGFANVGQGPLTFICCINAVG